MLQKEGLYRIELLSFVNALESELSSSRSREHSLVDSNARLLASAEAAQSKLGLQEEDVLLVVKELRAAKREADIAAEVVGDIVGNDNGENEAPNLMFAKTTTDEKEGDAPHTHSHSQPPGPPHPHAPPPRPPPPLYLLLLLLLPPPPPPLLLLLLRLSPPPFTPTARPSVTLSPVSSP